MAGADSSKMFRYIQSVALPPAYPDPYVPDISIKNDRFVSTETVRPITYTLNADQTLEVLLIAPCYYPGSSTISKKAVLLSKVNPQIITSLDARYNVANDVFPYVEELEKPGYCHKVSACITATGLTNFEGMWYMKSITTGVATTQLGLTNGGNASPKTIFDIPQNHQLWINYFPENTEKRTLALGAYLPGRSMHYMARFKNPSFEPIKITVTGQCLVEKVDETSNIAPVVVKQTPLGITQHLFEQIRSDYTFVVWNPIDAIAAKSARITLREKLGNALNSVVSQWYDMMKEIPNIDLTKLTNFIIFYLE
jgi:hypothetical protein